MVKCIYFLMLCECRKLPDSFCQKVRGLTSSNFFHDLCEYNEGSHVLLKEIEGFLSVFISFLCVFKISFFAFVDQCSTGYCSNGAACTPTNGENPACT